MDQERYFLLVVDDYTRYTTAFPLRSKADVRGVLIPWIIATRHQLREKFRRDLPVPCLHSDRGGEFSSGLLAEFYRDEGIVQLFTLPASPQQNGIAERRIGLIMEAARTSMIHAAAPHFVWSFAVRYAAHQLNLWPRVSSPETSPTLRWTGKVGDASAFWVLGALSLVCDTTASKLSPRTLHFAFLGFPIDAPPWQFYHPRSRRVLSSQDVTFDESVCFYRLHLHVSHPVPLAPLFLVDPSPLVEPLVIFSDTSGPAEGGDPAADDTATTRRSPCLETCHGFPPRPSSPPLQPVAVDIGAAGGGDSGGEDAGGAVPGGAETGGAGPRGVETGGEGSGGADFGSADSAGADSRGATSPSGGGAVGAPTAGHGVGQQWQPSQLETPSPQQLREWVVRRGRSGAGAWSFTAPRAACPGGAGAVGAGGTGGAAGVGAGGTGGTGGARAAGPGGARSRGVGAAGAGGAAGNGGVGGATGAAGTGGAGGIAGARGVGAGGTRGTGGTRAFGTAGAGGGAGAGGATGDAGAGGAGAAGAEGAGAADGTDQSQPQLLPDSPLPAPAPHTEVTESLTERREPEPRASTPIHARHVARPRPPAVPGTHVMSFRHSSIPQRVPLPSPLASSLPYSPDPVSDLACVASPTVTRLLATVVTDPDFESTAAFAPVNELVDFAARRCLDYVTSLVTESEFVCPLSLGGEPALGSDVFEDRQFELECLAAALPRFASMLLRPEGDPDAPDILTSHSYAEAIAAQRDYKLHSLDFSTTFLQGSLHEEIWLRRPPGFTLSFPAGTQWSLRRPVYGLCRAPCEWHDTLRTTLAALRFAPSTADPSLFLRTDTSRPPFYVLVYVDDLVFATADTRALALVKAELQGRHTCTDLGPSAIWLLVLLATAHSSVYQSLALSSTFGRVRRAEWSVSRTCGLPHVDNKAMLALCHEQGQEHRTKHIALRYFLAREMQQHGQLRLSFVASRANTADVFTKALRSSDHQRFCTALGFVPTLPHLLVS
ncbi:unnamed protein product [Closterium sp. NIES-54]